MTELGWKIFDGFAVAITFGFLLLVLVDSL